MADYSEAVILEGDRPVPYVDLAVYVAPPCPKGRPLLARRVRNGAQEARDRSGEMERLLRAPGGMAKVLEEVLGREIANKQRRWSKTGGESGVTQLSSRTSWAPGGPESPSRP